MDDTRTNTIAVDDDTVSDGAESPSDQPVVDLAAQRAIDDLSNRIQELLDAVDAPELLKRLFCQSLDWQFVNQPIPYEILPLSHRSQVTDAVIMARHEDLRLCYIRLSQSELLMRDQTLPLAKLTQAWPTVLVAFSNFGQKQIDFCHKTVDGKIKRFSLDRSLFGAADLAQSVYAMRAFDVKDDEPAPQLEVAERLERQFKRIPRRLRRPRRGLDRDPFWREIGNHKLLTQIEEQQLRRSFQAGAKSTARDRLILSNLRLVVNIAYRYRRRGVPWDDLLQEGVCGLLRAADKFDPDRGFKFSTYATWWVRQFLGRHVEDHGCLIGTPIYFSRMIHSYRSLVRDHLIYFGIRPTDAEVQDFFRLDNDQMVLLKKAIAGLARPRRLPDLVAQESTNPAHIAIVREQMNALRMLLESRLKTKQVQILDRRFGLDGEAPETLEQIGKREQLTRERIRQIEAKGLEKLKEIIKERKSDFYVT